MRITVIGTGYVGLVAGACFAETGNRVVGLDKSVDKIERLKQGEIPIFEPGLQEIVTRNQREGRLSFTTDIAQAVADAELIFLAVGTPSGPNGEPNLTYLEEAARSVARQLKKQSRSGCARKPASSLKSFLILSSCAKVQQ